ncbi:glycosyltransferase family 2 protein [Flavobacterium antarcticum]|uniref:glycosyltransferase family 2 protein n=1 Tax=Flavobacterium antarcticum TaxID=271155 RepID=UPI0003B7A4BF|nr:galactosyltransferase-related protein [Flavobacterium antarcticum]
MITLVLTNRNRDIRIIKNCLDSLADQSNTDFEWFLVDYGSNESHLEELRSLIQNYSQIQFITCPTYGQLWSKCRAINIALKKASYSFFFVGDIDMIFHPNFMKKIISSSDFEKVIYFKVGFINKQESLKETTFGAYDIAFTSDKEATGMTLYPTAALKAINGFDEFYQGWGAEDTDVHIRMQNAGYTCEFYDTEVLVKHQWHPKTYRSNLSKQPYHSSLERINHAYMVQTRKAKITLVNQSMEWGMPTAIKAYEELKNPVATVQYTNSVVTIKALLAQFKNFKNQVVKIKIKEEHKKEVFKNTLKRFVRKKHDTFYSMEVVNNLILEEIITNFRNCPYDYSFDRHTNQISVIINFTA